MGGAGAKLFVQIIGQRPSIRKEHPIADLVGEQQIVGIQLCRYPARQGKGGAAIVLRDCGRCRLKTHGTQSRSALGADGRVVRVNIKGGQQVVCVTIERHTQAAAGEKVQLRLPAVGGVSAPGGRGGGLGKVVVKFHLYRSFVMKCFFNETAVREGRHAAGVTKAHDLGGACFPAGQGVAVGIAALDKVGKGRHHLA